MSEIAGREHWERGLDGDRKQPRLVIDTCHPASNFASIAWSGDGLVLAGALNGTVKLWSRSNQTRLLTLKGGSAPRRSQLRCRPGGRWDC